ncbi:retrotransposon protein, putative, ty1-copia subclass [Tanacetum coccineum]
MSQNLAVSLILVSLRKEYDSFVQNYNMHGMGKTVNELHAMLKLHEQNLPKRDAPALHTIRAGKVQKKNKNKKPQLAAKGNNKGKGKSKLAYAPKPKIHPPPKKKDPAKDLNKKLPQGASTSGIFTIELFAFPSKSWVYDTGCGTHICNTTQGFRRSRKLKPGALSLYMGNGQRAAVEAIESYDLCFPSGLVIVLHNCQYAPSITRGVISVSRLYDDGFFNRFKDDNSISVSKNNLIYFNVVPRDGISEIVLSNSNTNDRSMYAVSNKRAKLNLDSSLLWHCRLGHISKKRIENLQHDRLLNSIDTKSFEKCVSCLSRKMARNPYSHQVERAKDLLGLIHTDVCSPFRIVSRQGASYFVTFTDDFSRYGYVYLLKHKHEVFETFKVFQKEVENQLGKTIKSLRSDRGGEYMSQEFLDHLKEHGIISHRTPPYKPQHNGVSERRNRTLLDMVRTMMSLTTLPKSFGIMPLKASGSLEDLEIIQEEDTHPSENTSSHHDEDDQEIDESQSDIIPIRRSTRTRHAPDRMCLNIKADEYELGDLNELANYKAALLDPEFDKWLSVMNVKMQSIKENEVWDLVDLPPNGKTVGIKWLFKKKTDMDGAVHTYKGDIRAIRILIAITAFYDYEIWQMDVKTAFLNGYLFEEQASRQWNKRFDDEIKKFGFTQNRDEPCVYMKASGSYVTFLILYVDDILIMGNNIPMLQDVKSYLERCFAMKDLREAAYILRIKIYRDRSKRLIGLCQSAYIEKILKRYYMENSKCGHIPMQEKLKLSKSQGASTPTEVKRMHNIPYASAVGSIMYAVRCTRHDVAFAQNITCRFQHNPELRVSCYTDVGYLTDVDDLKSQTGYVFVLNGGAIDWKSTKQSIFATSSAEAEYIAASDALKEAVWVRKFIAGLGVVPTIEEPIKMYCDNTGAITIANESGITKGARHYHAKVHYLREVIKYGDVKLEKVHTDDNLADPFTKALAFPKHSEHTKNIGMLPASNLM